MGKTKTTKQNRIGPKTEKLLLEFGLDTTDIADLKSGKMAWNISPSTGDEQDSWLLLQLDCGAQGVGGKLTSGQADILTDAWDFERRGGLENKNKNLFEKGEYGDWVGIRPDSDWSELVSSYRQASLALGHSLDKTTTAPYLFLCRHTLELQLKAVIMIGQRALSLEADLPGHHDLQRLWTGAFPIAKPYSSKAMPLATVKLVIDAFDEADKFSYNFRYPVTKNDGPIKHSEFVHAFSASGHLKKFTEATDILNSIIRRLRTNEMFASWSKAMDQQ